MKHPGQLRELKNGCGWKANPDFCLFRGGDTRSRAEIEAQLGTEYPGVIISDD